MMLVFCSGGHGAAGRLANGDEAPKPETLNPKPENPQP